MKQIKYKIGMIVELPSGKVQLVQFQSEIATHEKWLVSFFDKAETSSHDLPKYKEE